MKNLDEAARKSLVQVTRSASKKATQFSAAMDSTQRHFYDLLNAVETGEVGIEDGYDLAECLVEETIDVLQQWRGRFLDDLTTIWCDITALKSK